MMKTIACILLVLLSISGCHKKQELAYLDLQGEQIRTTHAIAMKLKIKGQYQPIAPVNYQPSFNKHPFNVSLAAFIGINNFIMIHAETVEDKSGASNYSDLDSTKLQGFTFHYRDPCAELTNEEIDREHDLSYLKTNGFNLLPAVYLQQYLMTSPDHNTEFIISYGKRVQNCTDSTLTPALKKAVRDSLLHIITLSSTSNK